MASPIEEEEEMKSLEESVRDEDIIRCNQDIIQDTQMIDHSYYLIGIPRDMSGAKIIEELDKRDIPQPIGYETIPKYDAFGIDTYIIKLKYDSAEPIEKIMC